MKRYVGLDLSLTSSGVAIIEYRKATIWTHCERIRPGKLRGVERLRYIRDAVRKLVDGPATEAIAIEGYAHGRSNQAHQLGELGGVVRVDLVSDGYCVHTVTPATLKKIAAGTGNAGKPQVAVGAFKRWGFEHESDDVVDAYVLARCIGHHFESDWPTKAMAAAWKSEVVT